MYLYYRDGVYINFGLRPSGQSELSVIDRYLIIVVSVRRGSTPGWVLRQILGGGMLSRPPNTNPILEKVCNQIITH